jgi:hypothetical protein
VKGQVLAALFLALLSAPGCQSQPGGHWLVVAGRFPSATEAIQAVRKLQPGLPEATVVASDDCANQPGGQFLAVAGPVLKSRSAAENALAKAKPAAQQAAIAECQAKPDSRIAAGLPTIDPSILKLPESVVNWEDKDKISELVRLSSSSQLWLRRWYDPAPDDPREGMRVAVAYLGADATQPKEVTADCMRPLYASQNNLLALSCVRGPAGNQLLHYTQLIDVASGAVLATAERCRTPRFTGPNEVTCQSESVDAEGNLTLQPRKLP